MHEALRFFHPAVADWFDARFDAPTDAQRGAWAPNGGRHRLITAPTGSGKTLAAFLAALNRLVKRGLDTGLEDSVDVLYVSPLKALSNDIEKNLEAPLSGIRDQLLERGLPDVEIRTAVRTGDTTPGERERMRRRPPQVLVTTPESLYILLTSDAGRRMLSTVRSVIVDELHAVAATKRGAHLMLSLERLSALCDAPPERIGLSATVKPVADMARFLCGEEATDCTIVDAGHARERDLALALSDSPLEAVMANEVWGEIYDRLAALIEGHRTTLIFVNNRRLAERATRHLAERVGEQHVTAHHGSLSKEHRLRAEQRLKDGQLRALVATASLELGIDIGDIDLVCQMGSPRLISALLQRVGRAGHAVDAVPKGRLFPLSLDDLVECTALLDAVRRGELDHLHVPDAPLDVLAQQLVAEVACREWGLDELFNCIRRATPYRNLSREGFVAVVRMLADGYTTRRGRRGAHLHFDAINGRLRGRRGARLTAVTNAGVIPDQFDYDVVMAPEELRIGSVGEDFAFESLPGDIFQLGNRSYRVLKVETARVRVEDAHGEPPTMPFWFGEAPGRSDELSAAVSRLREDAERILLEPDHLDPARGGQAALRDWLEAGHRLPPGGARQLAEYLATAHAALGTLPTLRRVVFERFFDEVGDTHLVVHAPFGSRVNRAWGLALRKRFCRQFNFELQAAALEDSLVLSLGPTHAFPLEDVQRFLHSATARDVLVQALLDAPMFPARWRWNAATSLAVQRRRGGQRLPPPFQRADAEDLMAVLFPDQLACAENLTGEREIPDHPLVQQAIEDCLHETMDVDGFLGVLRGLERGSIEVHCRELAAPSPLSHAILGARPYAFLDDGDAEGRRTRAVSIDRRLDPRAAADLGRLDPAAIARVRDEARPAFGNADELHDALLVHGFLTPEQVAGHDAALEDLAEQRRAVRLPVANTEILVAAERQAQVRAAMGGDATAQREVLRSRLEGTGPITAAELGAPLGLDTAAVLAALHALEGEGGVMRGAFEPGAGEQWCDRGLLLRIHRQTRDRKRAAVQPVSPARYLRFLFRWQRVLTESGDDRREGEDGLHAVLLQLEGRALPAAAWEEDVLPARVRRYAASQLDRLCAAGRIAWARRADRRMDTARRNGPVRNTPMLVGPRETLALWQRPPAQDADPPVRSARAERILALLRTGGASFLDDLAQDAGMLPSDVEQALGELVSRGEVTSDAFSGLRALIAPAAQQRRRRRHRRVVGGMDAAGRWSLPRARRIADPDASLADPAVEHVARTLLHRYGVVFRALVACEDALPPWRELFDLYRRLEARGEILGGRFVSGFAGEQFALPEAAAALQRPATGRGAERVSVSAADPLNLTGVITPGERVPALAGNRVLFEDGVPLAVLEGGAVRLLRDLDPRASWEVRNQLLRRQQPSRYHHAPERTQ